MLMEELLTGQKSKYVVQFQLRCFSPESRCHVLLTYLPEIKDFTYQKILDEEEYSELESMLHSVGIEFRNLVKVPYVEEEEEASEEESETDDPVEEIVSESGNENALFMRLFDELLSIREDIHETVASESEDKESLITKKAQKFNQLGDAFRRHLKGDLRVGSN